MIPDWFRVDCDIVDSPKVGRLADALRTDVAKAIGHVVAVFAKVRQQRPLDGSLVGVSDTMLEQWALWAGKRGRFADAFRAEFVGDGILTGWADRQAPLIKRVLAERERAKQNRERAKESPDSTPTSTRTRSRTVLRQQEQEQVQVQHRDLRSSEISPPSRGEESGATSAPEPRSLALVRPESPTVLPALVDEPALPATRTRVARAKTPPRSGGEITAALSAWIDDTRAGAVHRQRADEERRNLAGVVFVYWQSVWQKPDAMLDDKREKLIVDRLRENGNNLDELLHAIDGGKRNTFAKGRGGALRLLLGDRGAVEEFAGEVGTRRLDAHPRADALRRALAPVVATPTEVVLHA